MNEILRISKAQLSLPLELGETASKVYKSVSNDPCLKCSQ